MTGSGVEYVSLVHELAAWNDNEIDRGTDLLVLLALATFINRKTGATGVSLPHLAERSRLNVKTVRAVLRRLEEAEKIQVDRTEKPTGRPFRIVLTFSTAPTGSGATEIGTPTESGSTGSGADPYRKREGTPTDSGTRTKGSSSKKEGATLSLVAAAPVDISAGLPPTTCSRHPTGSDRPCRGCQEARLAAEAAARVQPAAPRVDGCTYMARTGHHFMIDGDRFCNTCGLDPSNGDRINLASSSITRAERASA